MVLDSKRMEMVKIMLLLFFLIKQNQDAAGHEITNHRYNECHHYWKALNANYIAFHIYNLANTLSMAFDIKTHLNK